MKLALVAVGVVSLVLFSGAVMATTTGTIYVNCTSATPAVASDLSKVFNNDGCADSAYGSGGLGVGQYNLVSDIAWATAGGDSRFFDKNLWSSTSPSSQDSIFQATADQPISPVPEPLTVTAVMLAISGLGFYIRRCHKVSPATAAK